MPQWAAKAALRVSVMKYLACDILVVFIYLMQFELNETIQLCESIAGLLLMV